jgi:putative ABC transport system permease protein
VLGAPSRRLVGLVLTGALIFAAAGGLLGVAYGGIRLLPLLDSGMLPRGSHASLNTPVLAFSAAASLASGLLFGLAPLRDVRRTRFDSVLRDGTRTSAGTMRDRTRSILLVAEIAFSVLLLIGGGLLARTFLNLYSFNPGFSGERVLSFRLLLPGERYNPEAAPTFPTDLEHALRAVPGVESAGVINQLPLDDEPNYGTSFWTRETVATSDTAPLADARIVTPGYFETIRAQLTAGRWLSEEDNASGPFAIVVDERLARRAWPGRNPVGQDLLLGSRDGAWGRVVGVVRHLRHHRLTEEVPALLENAPGCPVLRMAEGIEPPHPEVTSDLHDSRERLGRVSVSPRISCQHVASGRLVVSLEVEAGAAQHVHRREHARISVPLQLDDGIPAYDGSGSICARTSGRSSMVHG